MQIRQLKVHRFRGIESLEWRPSSYFCCVIGSGDSGKSSILDAIEAVLSTRWMRYSEADFFECDTEQAFQIELTIGELSPALKSDERFGLNIRGWTSAGELRDEPEGDDEPVLTVQLVVDATLEPVWSLVCERHSAPRTLSNRDRLLFGCIRLTGDDSRHLAWGQGSILSRLTGDKEEAAGRLAEAYKAARESAKLSEIPSLIAAANTAEQHSRKMGAYISDAYVPGLELGRSGLSSGAISLHDGSAPLRLAGLGTRRLATLAMQRSTISEGAIVLIDEVELGLEPHRIIGAISQLRGSQVSASENGDAIGQIVLTTHSDVALAECGAESLHICRLPDPVNRTVSLCQPTNLDSINALMRHTPRALFARRILVTEGMTEVGLFLGLREFWRNRHENIPIEQLGAAVADGNGKQAVALCTALSNLGFPVALFRDSDVPLEAYEITAINDAGVHVIEYVEPMSTEQAIYEAASDENLQIILDAARAEYDDDPINDAIIAKLDCLDRATVKNDVKDWPMYASINGHQVRAILSEVATRKKWMKDSRISRALAPVVFAISEDSAESSLSKALNEAERWLYA